MTKAEHINYWLTTAAHDLDVAESLFQNGKHDWCLFVSHLVIEKMLKAFWVRDANTKVPHIHNLLVIANGTQLQFSDEQKQFLEEITTFNIQGRYPSQKLAFYKLCTQEFTTSRYNKIKELYQWLLSQITSAKVSKS